MNQEEKAFCDSFFGTDAQITKTDKGLTNRVYEVHASSGHFALRLPRPEIKDHQSFSNEPKALALVSGQSFAPTIEYYNPTTRILVTRWLEQSTSYADSMDPNKIERVAHLLKEFHGLDLHTGTPFDGIRLYHQYQEATSHILYPFEDAKIILEAYRQLNHPMILCHNDVVSGNLLLSPTQACLIDYEYAKDNDPLFDVMSFLTENKITNPQERDRFYTAYFGFLPTEDLARDLSITEDFENLLWLTWAQMMFEQFREPIYQSIAQDKATALRAKGHR